MKDVTDVSVLQVDMLLVQNVAEVIMHCLHELARMAPGSLSRSKKVKAETH